MTYKVTYAIDSLDTNPTTVIFEEEWEAIDWLDDEITKRIDYVVQHRAYSTSETELEELREVETSLARIEEIDNAN